ncbi:unnamed protein product [Adineta ricciae]|uniref:Uncharacterized protein n=1 Tax=Adineta ricciae TaxID=249248 RepID=A0A813Z2N8_ADIRI|nr:unnamed protein product [Adineta ricciae]
MMQLQHIGYPQIPPVDQFVPIGAEPIKEAPPRRRWATFLAIGLLALGLFLLAATIVLALIPIYTSKQTQPATIRTLTSPFTLPISSNTILTASTFNTAQLAYLQSIFQQRLDSNRKTSGSTITVNSASALVKSKRRKRQTAGSITGTYTITYPSTILVTSFNTLNSFTLSNDQLTQLQNLQST